MVLDTTPRPAGSASLGKKLALSFFSVVFTFAAMELILWRADVASPPTFHPDPAYGYLMAPGQSVATRGYRFWINAAGLRGPEIAMPKPSGVYRISFLGDSITYGGGIIHDDQLFSSRVSSALTLQLKRTVEAINISAPGWGVGNMAAFVMGRGTFDSDLLIWVISAPDLRRPVATFEESGFSETKPLSRVWYAVRVSVIKFSAGVKRARASASESSGRPEQLEKNLQTVAGELPMLLAKGTRVAIVLVPGVRGYDTASDVARFRAVAESCAVPFLDTADAMQGPRIKDYYIDDVHLSTQGHAVVAGAIGPFVADHFLRARSGAAPAAAVPSACGTMPPRASAPSH